MNKAQVIQAIYDVLDGHMMIPQIDAFHEDARLNQDLYLDSVLVLELILNLETELGMDIPDDALTKDDFETVSNLADFLMVRSGNAASESSKNTNLVTEQAVDQEQEEFEDVKVHCFVSCICDIIKPHPLVDHRPFYFGVWDAEIVINQQHQLDYHSETLNHDNFRHWYKALYSVDVSPWYDKTLSKSENLNKLTSLVENKPDHQRVMVMIDMYRLPERENKFNQNPFPHYVMLETTDNPDQWMMLDPDFRWEGIIAKDKILNAVASPAVEGGYIFDSQQIQASQPQAIKAYYLDSFNADHNPMTDAVRNVVNHHVENALWQALPDALKQLPVLAIRKYAYEHGIAFFLLEKGVDLDVYNPSDLDSDLDQNALEVARFEEQCVVIEQLVESYKLVQYRAMKLAKPETSDDDRAILVQEITEILDQQDAREFSIKQHLNALFVEWCSNKKIESSSIKELVEP